MPSIHAKPAKRPPTRFPSSLSTAREWAAFGKRLALVLAVMEEDEILVISEKGERNVYVQFMARGFFGMFAEAVSNEYLEKEHRLNKAQIAMLRKIGWQPPKATDREAQKGRGKGSPNFHIDSAGPVPCDLLADAAVRALRDVYRTPHPSELMYKTFCADQAVEQYEFRFPTLGLKRNTQ